MSVFNAFPKLDIGIVDVQYSMLKILAYSSGTLSFFFFQTTLYLSSGADGMISGRLALICILSAKFSSLASFMSAATWWTWSSSAPLPCLSCSAHVVGVWWKHTREQMCSNPRGKTGATLSSKSVQKVSLSLLKSYRNAMLGAYTYVNLWDSSFKTLLLWKRQ